MSTLKKIWKFIGSMRFAIALLVVLALACMAGSFVTQGQSYAWYAQRYGDRLAALILTLHLDDAFHSWWFLLINAFLCLNLLLCNLTRLPRLISRTRAEADPNKALAGRGDVRCAGIADPDALFGKLGMPKAKAVTAPDGREAKFTGKHRAGLWGAWVCHLGILLVILGFGLGQMTQRQYTAYGVPGQSRPIGDTGYVLTIDDFRVGLRDDDTVEQYTADITVRDLRLNGDGRAESATISVNNPATLFGMKFYQNSTGWAARVQVTKDGEPLQDEVVCAGDYLRVKDKEDLVVVLNAFYPDYVLVQGAGPSTASGQLNNPAYLYSVYYQEQMLGMNALMQDEKLTIDEYEVTFSEPQNYTLIQVKVDHFTWLALVGGLVTLLGLVLAFYVQPARAWAVRDADGSWTAFGQSRKGGALFRERFARAAGKDPEPDTGEERKEDDGDAHAAEEDASNASD